MNPLRRRRLARDVEAVADAYVRGLDPYRDVPDGLTARREVQVIADFRDGWDGDVTVIATVTHVSRPWPPDSIVRPDWAHGLLLEIADLLRARGSVTTEPQQGDRSAQMNVTAA